ncbi:MAG: DUF58 domain-containing protein [Phycisphaerales bacterium]|nr:DUF58 domain-containing protein [Phycisphaerales bacterium]
MLHAPGRPNTPQSLEEALGADLVEVLGRMRLRSRKIFAGKLPGERRSKKRGQSVEFDDFREYVRGDDLRHIDWNVYARLEKLFLKLFLEEEDLALHVAVDCSRSMEAGRPPKLDLARRLAVAVAYVGLSNQDRVSLWAFGVPGRPPLLRMPPVRGRSGVNRLLEFVYQQALPMPGEVSTNRPELVPALLRLSRARVGKGVLVVLSDFLTEEDLTPALNAMAFAQGGGFDSILVQVLAPGELDPSTEADAGLLGDVMLTDVESGRTAEVTITPTLIAQYRKRLGAHNERLARLASARGIGHMLVPSDMSAREILTGSLRHHGVLS